MIFESPTRSVLSVFVGVKLRSLPQLIPFLGARAGHVHRTFTRKDEHVASTTKWHPSKPVWSRQVSCKCRSVGHHRLEHRRGPAGLSGPPHALCMGVKNETTYLKNMTNLDTEAFVRVSWLKSLLQRSRVYSAKSGRVEDPALLNTVTQTVFPCEITIRRRGRVV